MNLDGRLEDLAVAELLHVIGISHRSGELSVETGGREHRLLFERGRLVAARRGARKRGLADLVIRMGIADETHVAVLERQARGGEDDVLTLLEKEGRITRPQWRQAVEERVEQHVEELLAAREGTFRFELLEDVVGRADDYGDAMLGHGLDPSRMPSVNRKRSAGIGAGLGLPRQESRRKARLLVPEDAISLPSLSRGRQGAGAGEGREAASWAESADSGVPADDDRASATPAGAASAVAAGARDAADASHGASAGASAGANGRRVLLGLSDPALRGALERAAVGAGHGVEPVTSLDGLRDRIAEIAAGESSPGESLGRLVLVVDGSSSALPPLEALATVRAVSRLPRAVLVLGPETEAERRRLRARAAVLGVEDVVLAGDRSPASEPAGPLDEAAAGGDPAAASLAEWIVARFAVGDAAAGDPEPVRAAADGSPDWIAGESSPAGPDEAVGLSEPPDAAELARDLLCEVSRHLSSGLLVCNLGGLPRVRGAFGPGAPAVLRSVAPLVDGTDFLSEAARSAEPHVGPPPVGDGDEALIEALGRPEMVVLLPLPGGGRPVGVLHAEIEEGASPDVEALSALVADVAPRLGEALERHERRDEARRARLSARLA